MATITIPANLVTGEDDLTILTKSALVKRMREEGNAVVDDKEAMKAIEAQAKTDEGVSVTDALKAIHRQFRIAKGTATEKQFESWKLVVPVVAVHQLGRDCFLGALKYRDLTKVSVNREVQRPESKRRIPDIATYVSLDDGYFSAVIVTISGAAGGSVMFDNGELIIQKDAIITVNDGQHRIAGIKKAIANGLDEARLDDDLPVLFYTDLTQGEQRQLFTDINENAKKPPKAITNNFDERDAARHLAHELVRTSATFRDKTSFVKTRIGVKDNERFTFSIIVDAVEAMWPKDDAVTHDNIAERLPDAVEFWRQVDATMGTHFDAKNFAVTKNAMVAMAKLFGMNVDFEALAALDWSANGELSRVAGIAGGTNAAVKALFDEIKTKVVE